MFLRIYTGATTWFDGLKARAADEGGATAVEYALMVALIAVVIIAAVSFLGNSASDQFECVGDSVATSADACRKTETARTHERPVRRPLTLPERSVGVRDRRTTSKGSASRSDFERRCKERRTAARPTRTEPRSSTTNGRKKALEGATR